MSDQPQPPFDVVDNITWEPMTYLSLQESIGNAETLELLTVTGVATMHRLYLRSIAYQWDRLTYIVTPESGPMDYIVNRFPREERKLPSWVLPTGSDEASIAEMDRRIQAVQHYVVEQAAQELKDNR